MLVAPMVPATDAGEGGPSTASAPALHVEVVPQLVRVTVRRESEVMQTDPTQDAHDPSPVGPG